VLTAAIPASYTSREGTVVVTAVAAGQRLSDSALAVGLSQRAAAAPAVVDAGPRPADLGPAFLRSSLTLYAALAAMFLGLLFLFGTAVSAIRGRDRVSGRLEIYTLAGRSGREQLATGEGGKSVARSVMGVADKVVKNRDLETRLGQRLDAGGIPLKPAEWLLLHLGIAFCVPLLVLFLTNANIVLTVLAVFLSVFGPWGYLKVKKALRTRAFLAQLPDVLQLMSGSLSAGYSLPQAVDAVVRQGNEPVATEFNKALVEARIGAPIEDALDDVGTRMGSVDFGWVVMAIRIQRDVGGNLAEILSTVSATLRERERLRRQVQVLSAEGKLSAYILGGLPIAFGFYLLLTRPDYLKPLITDPIGWLLLGGMAMLMVVGSFWMKKVVTVEV
jgi:tight adherence protein B